MRRLAPRALAAGVLDVGIKFRRQLTLAEVSGALGDLGTFLPLVVGAWEGVWWVTSGGPELGRRTSPPVPPPPPHTSASSPWQRFLGRWGTWARF